MDILVLLLGMILLLGGGELLVRGATALARSLGVSTLVIGLTVVAFGTSAPELAVNITAALRGQGGISFGNIMGSNIANIALILGLAALVAPLNVKPTVSRREIPYMMVATLGVVLLGLDSFWGMDGDRLGRFDGSLLLLAFAAFLRLTLRRTRRSHPDEAFTERALAEEKRRHARSTLISLMLTLTGLAGVLLGGHWTVEGATAIAKALGVSDTIIGLTVVAIGTSLPELVTSIIATRQGQVDLAVGNIVGSNLFNLLLVLGPTSLIRPISVPAGGRADLAAVLIFSAALMVMARTKENRITRVEGLFLLIGYFAYVLWRLAPSI